MTLPNNHPMYENPRPTFWEAITIAVVSMIALVVGLFFFLPILYWTWNWWGL